MLPESSYEPDDPIVLNTRGQEGKDKGSTESDGLAVGVGAEHGIGRQCGGGRVRYHIREWDDGLLAGGIIGLESSHLSSPPSSQLLGLLSPPSRRSCRRRPHRPLCCRRVHPRPCVLLSTHRRTIARLLQALCKVCEHVRRPCSSYHSHCPAILIIVAFHIGSSRNTC